MSDSNLRTGEMAVELPAETDVGVYFIGTIRTPWPAASRAGSVATAMARIRRNAYDMKTPWRLPATHDCPLLPLL